MFLDEAGGVWLREPSALLLGVCALLLSFWADSGLTVRPLRLAWLIALDAAAFCRRRLGRLIGGISRGMDGTLGSQPELLVLRPKRYAGSPRGAARFGAEDCCCPNRPCSGRLRLAGSARRDLRPAERSGVFDTPFRRTYPPRHAEAVHSRRSQCPVATAARDSCRCAPRGRRIGTDRR
jgi:hypothetical protein